MNKQLTPHQKYLQEQEAEKKRVADAFRRAELEIARLGITDYYMEATMAGKKIGGIPSKPFPVEDGDAIWEMIENGVDSQKIVDKIYDTRGKMKYSSTQYMKNKYGKK